MLARVFGRSIAELLRQLRQAGGYEAERLLVEVADRLRDRRSLRTARELGIFEILRSRMHENEAVRERTLIARILLAYEAEEEYHHEIAAEHGFLFAALTVGLPDAVESVVRESRSGSTLFGVALDGALYWLQLIVLLTAQDKAVRVLTKFTQRLSSGQQLSDGQHNADLFAGLMGMYVKVCNLSSMAQYRPLCWQVVGRMLQTARLVEHFCQHSENLTCLRFATQRCSMNDAQLQEEVHVWGVVCKLLESGILRAIVSGSAEVTSAALFTKSGALGASASPTSIDASDALAAAAVAAAEARASAARAEPSASASMSAAASASAVPAALAALAPAAAAAASTSSAAETAAGREPGEAAVPSNSALTITSSAPVSTPTSAASRLFVQTASEPEVAGVAGAALAESLPAERAREHEVDGPNVPGDTDRRVLGLQASAEELVEANPVRAQQDVAGVVSHVFCAFLAIANGTCAWAMPRPGAALQQRAVCGAVLLAWCGVLRWAREDPLLRGGLEAWGVHRSDATFALLATLVVHWREFSLLRMAVGAVADAFRLALGPVGIERTGADHDIANALAVKYWCCLDMHLDLCCLLQAAGVSRVTLRLVLDSISELQDWPDRGAAYLLLCGLAIRSQDSGPLEEVAGCLMQKLMTIPLGRKSSLPLVGALFSFLARLLETSVGRTCHQCTSGTSSFVLCRVFEGLVCALSGVSCSAGVGQAVDAASSDVGNFVRDLRSARIALALLADMSTWLLRLEQGVPAPEGEPVGSASDMRATAAAELATPGLQLQCRPGFGASVARMMAAQQTMTTQQRDSIIAAVVSLLWHSGERLPADPVLLRHVVKQLSRPSVNVCFAHRALPLLASSASPDVVRTIAQCREVIADICSYTCAFCPSDGRAPLMEPLVYLHQKLATCRILEPYGSLSTSLRMRLCNALLRQARLAISDMTTRAATAHDGEALGILELFSVLGKNSLAMRCAMVRHAMCRHMVGMLSRLVTWSALAGRTAIEALFGLADVLSDQAFGGACPPDPTFTTFVKVAWQHSQSLLFVHLRQLVSLCEQRTLAFRALQRGAVVHLVQYANPSALHPPGGCSTAEATWLREYVRVFMERYPRLPPALPTMRLELERLPGCIVDLRPEDYARDVGRLKQDPPPAWRLAWDAEIRSDSTDREAETAAIPNFITEEEAHEQQPRQTYIQPETEALPQTQPEPQPQQQPEPQPQQQPEPQLQHGQDPQAEVASPRHEHEELEREFVTAASRLPPEELRDFVNHQVGEELAQIARLPREQRPRAFRVLAAEWHPDKCRAIPDLAKEVFQRLQAEKDKILKVP